MANDINALLHFHYAMRALEVMKQFIGTIPRVYMGYDAEYNGAREKGDVIQIERPSNITVSEGGSGTTQDLKVGKTAITLDQFKQTRFEISDKDLTLAGGERAIMMHIMPAAQALAANINTALTSAIVTQCPWSYDAALTDIYADFIGCRSKLMENAGQLLPGNTFWGVNLEIESLLQKNANFIAANVAGSGVPTSLYDGELVTRVGVNPYIDTTLTKHTGGTVLIGADQALALAADAKFNDTVISVNGAAVGETFVAGDNIVIAGNTQRYSITEGVTLTAGAGLLKINPPLVQDYAAAAVVTAEKDSATVHAGSYNPSIMFHRNAVGLVFAKLSTIGNDLGNAKMSVVTDPDTGITLRSRVHHDDASAKVIVTLDVLYGVKVIDPNLAVVFRSDAA